MSKYGNRMSKASEKQISNKACCGACARWDKDTKICAHMEKKTNADNRCIYFDLKGGFNG